MNIFKDKPFGVGDLVVVTEFEHGFQPGTLAIVVGVEVVASGSSMVRVVSSNVNSCLGHIELVGYYATPESLCKVNADELLSGDMFMWGERLKCL